MALGAYLEVQLMQQNQCDWVKLTIIQSILYSLKIQNRFQVILCHGSQTNYRISLKQLCCFISKLSNEEDGVMNNPPPPPSTKKKEKTKRKQTKQTNKQTNKQKNDKNKNFYAWICWKNKTLDEVLNS